MKKIFRKLVLRRDTLKTLTARQVEAVEAVGAHETGCTPMATQLASTCSGDLKPPVE